MSNIPKLDDCRPGIRATGFCVLIALAEQSDVTRGGIWKPDAVTAKDAVVEQRGRVVSMSSAAFDFAAFNDADIPSIGDAVVISKLAGVQVDGDDGRKYRLVQDRDVIAIMDGEAAA